MTTATRDQFIEVAGRLFAERGFYGASIAAIAGEMGLTKQALLHHFGSKEKLYGQVLRHLSEDLIVASQVVTADNPDPTRRIEALVLLQYQGQMANVDSARLIMRELLDNEQRAENAGNWYLRPYLEVLVDAALQVEHCRTWHRGRALALIYQLLGAAHYFAVSQPTLKSIFGPELLAITKKTFEGELRCLIRARLQASAAGSP
ncbi:MAG: TetR/AcrR family transcriptional regulator [Pseudomonadota bacterium]